LVCTYERNLGDDPEKSVTQACGTGCTFVGAEQMRKLKNNKVVAQCLGGNLVIEKKGNSIYMSGDVIQLN
jgi:diaminopimelate epimerase